MLNVKTLKKCYNIAKLIVTKNKRPTRKNKIQFANIIAHLKTSITKTHVLKIENVNNNDISS